MQFVMHELFRKKIRHLAVKMEGTETRFCAICGEQVRGGISKLDRHCKRQHLEQKDKSVSNEGFLIYRNLPSDCKYENFEDFLKNPYTYL